MRVFHFLAAVLAVDEVRDELHRARPVKGVHGNQVFNVGRLEVLEVHAHAFRLELERTDGVAALVELVGFLVVDRNVVDVDLDAVVFLNQVAWRP